MPEGGPKSRCSTRKAPQGSVESGLRPGSLEAGGSACAPRATPSTRRRTTSLEVHLIPLPRSFKSRAYRCAVGDAAPLRVTLREKPWSTRPRKARKAA
jgi:hypothetical protein